MSMRKIQAIFRVSNTRPLGDVSESEWLNFLGIDDSTSLEDLEKTEQMLEDLSNEEYYKLVVLIEGELIIKNVDDLEKAINSIKHPE